MLAGNDLIVNNRRLLELLDMNQLKPDHEIENIELSELFFNSLISNINERLYFDIPFINLRHSFNNNKNTLSLLNVNMRLLNKQKIFDALYEFLISIPFSPNVICISRNAIMRQFISKYFNTKLSFTLTQLQTRAVWPYTSL